jgi:copper resistance protein D
MSLYHANVTLHVLAAMLWIGGMFFFALVGAPVLRKIESQELRARLFRQLGEKFRTIGWVAIVILIATGIANLHFRGWLDSDVLGSRHFWTTAVGTALAWKLGAVVAMLVVQAFHDFNLGPASSRAAAGTPESIRLRRRAALLARLSAILGLVVVIAAVYLARPR